MLVGYLTIFMLTNQFHLQGTEKTALRDICIFIVHSYVKMWFTATDPIQAPLNDFMFLKQMAEYRDRDTSTAALVKFCGHLWYLSSEAVGTSFFDSRLPKDVKLKMVQATRSTVESEVPIIKKVIMRPMDIKYVTSEDISQS